MRVRVRRAAQDTDLPRLDIEAEAAERLEGGGRWVGEGDVDQLDAAIHLAELLTHLRERVALGRVVEALEELLGGIRSASGVGGHHGHPRGHHHHHEDGHDGDHDLVHEEEGVVLDAAGRITLELEAEEVPVGGEP